jgi:hypothetical protein
VLSVCVVTVRQIPVPQRTLTTSASSAPVGGGGESGATQAPLTTAPSGGDAPQAKKAKKEAGQAKQDKAAAKEDKGMDGTSFFCWL